MKLAASRGLWRRLFRLSQPSVARLLVDEAAELAACSASRSHVGKVRAINEDRLLECSREGIWAIADGMGGHSAGDIAAETAITALRALANQERPVTVPQVKEALCQANARLRWNVAEGAAVSGATVVALVMAGNRATIFWVGDCRAYRFRDGRLEQLTRDHSVVQELVESGALTPERASHHPQSHVVTRALGAKDDLNVDHVKFEVRAGDVFLLSSDGLCCSGQDLAATMARHEALEDMAAALLAEALVQGGRDNISLVLVRAE